MSGVNERLGVAETKIDNQEKITDEIKDDLYGPDGIRKELKTISESLGNILIELSIKKTNAKSNRDWLTISIAAVAVLSSSITAIITLC